MLIENQHILLTPADIFDVHWIVDCLEQEEKIEDYVNLDADGTEIDFRKFIIESVFSGHLMVFVCYDMVIKSNIGFILLDPLEETYSVWNMYVYLDIRRNLFNAIRIGDGLSKFIFESFTKIQKVVFKVHKNNGAALSVLNKMGYEPALFENDVYVYRLDYRDWMARRKKIDSDKIEVF